MNPLKITFAGMTLIIGCFVACSSKEISRERAADLIRSNNEFKRPDGVKLLTGKFCYDWRNLRDVYTSYAPLESADLLKVSDLGAGCGSMWLKRYNVELTSSGMARAKSWTTSDDKGWATDAQGSTTYFIPTASKELVEVTGITKDPEGGQAQAEFTWKWAPTEDASRFGKVPSAELKKGLASLQLYDDGWRIVNCCSEY
jgi:hypothetical protein